MGMEIQGGWAMAIDYPPPILSPADGKSKKIPFRFLADSKKEWGHGDHRY
jgi:hypothetical protein